MIEQEKPKSTRLSPTEVARLDPFGVRKARASEELSGLLGWEEKEQSRRLKIIEETLIRNTENSLKEFFGREINVPPLPCEVTTEKFFHWAELQMNLHYLPPIEMTPDKNFPGWKIKPGEKFYDLIREGLLAPDALVLPGKWVLIDNRDKPNFQEGKQIYPQDFLGPIIEKLFQRKLGSLQSRSYISWPVYQNILRPEIAEILKVKVEQVRLPRLVEFNFLGNAHYPQWGETNTSEWVEDNYYHQNQQIILRSGDSAHGGLAEVNFHLGFSYYQSSIQFRPLVEF